MARDGDRSMNTMEFGEIGGENGGFGSDTDDE